MAQAKIPAPDWISNLDEGAREKLVKLSILASERGGNESSICEEFSVTPAQAVAALSWVHQTSLSTASTSFLSGGESLKKNSGSTGKTQQQPSIVKTEAPAPVISTRHDLPKAASSRWGRTPRGEGRDRSSSKRKISSPKYRRRRKKSRMSTSMVSEITRLIIKVLQLKGAMTLEALAEQLCCKQEDVHNVLNGSRYISCSCLRCSRLRLRCT